MGSMVFMQGVNQTICRATVGIIICLGFLVSCVSGQDYPNPYGPVYENNYAPILHESDGKIKVVTWNLHFAENIAGAIKILEGVNEIKDADVLLLQEMDEIGVETIARRLSYNFVYYPASIHPHHGRNYGNAILTKWPIVRHEKIILPNSISRVKQLRIATMAQIMVGETLIDVYNAHLEITWMLQRSDRTQVDFLLSQIDPETNRVILGGDFNSWSPGSIDYLEKRTSEINLERVSSGTGYTFEYRGLRLTLDHLFSSATSDFMAGVWRDSSVSDHFPVWAIINFNSD